MTLRVHIERLVLDGFDFSAPDAAHFELALQAELVHRLSASGLSEGWRTGGSVEALRPVQISLPEKPTATQSGRAVARAIHGGIGR